VRGRFIAGPSAGGFSAPYEERSRLSRPWNGRQPSEILRNGRSHGAD
jgi:hypothetical protein